MDGLRAAGRGFAVGPACGCRSCRRRSSSTSRTAATRRWGENPYRRLGAAALAAAGEDFALGSEGAGTGAMTATLMGGLGSASFVTEAGTTVGALVAVNAFGVGRRARHAGVLGRGLRDRRRVRRARAGGGAGGAVHAAADEAGSGRARGQHHDRDRRDRPRARQGRGAAAGRGGAGRPRPGDPPGRTRRSTATWSSRSRPARGRDDRLEAMVVAHAAALCLARAVARGVHAARPAAGNLLPCWSEIGA